MKRSYLDHAATAPFDQRLVEVLAGASWANADSLHQEGREARAQLEDARKRIARALGARQPAEIIFTSGGTEGDNMALKGLIPANAKPEQTHVVVSTIEHHAVLDAASSLKKLGYKVDYVEPGKDGVMSPEALEAVLDSIAVAGGKTALVAVQAVNNELGTVQPVQELCDISHQAGALFFTDGVQALGRIQLNLEQWGVDAASFSGHKIGAPKGIGILYLRRGKRITPLVNGGGQESGLRSGTSNVPGAVALAKAVEFAVEERAENWEKIALLRQALLEGVASAELPRGFAPTLPGSAPCVPHVVNFLCDGLEGETMVHRFNALGVACSSGSACSTGSLDPSHVILAIGVPKQKAYGSLRVSFGPGNTMDDVSAFVSNLPEVLR